MKKKQTNGEEEVIVLQGDVCHLKHSSQCKRPAGKSWIRFWKEKTGIQGKTN